MAQGQAQPPRQTLATFGGGTPSARAKLNALVSVVNALKAGANLPIQSNGGSGGTIVIRITGGDADSGYSWVQVYLADDGTWTDTTDGLMSDTSGVAYELNGADGVPEDSIVQARRYQDQAGAYFYQFTFGNIIPYFMFPVQVQKVGGSNGTNSAAATYTYTVLDLNGVSIGTPIGQTRPRPIGAVTFQAGATGYGVAFYAADGTLKLWDAGEIPQVEACP